MDRNSFDEIKIVGTFSIRGINLKGEIVFFDTDNNMIVNNAKKSMARLISNSAIASSKVVTQIGFGTNTLTATPNNTTLSESYVNNILSYTYPEDNKVTFSWRLDYHEGNGKDISEFGLLSADGTLFARKVRGAIAKADDLALEGEWSIIF